MAADIPADTATAREGVLARLPRAKDLAAWRGCRQRAPNVDAQSVAQTARQCNKLSARTQADRQDSKIKSVVGKARKQSGIDHEMNHGKRWLHGDMRRLRLDKIATFFQTRNLLPFRKAANRMALVPQPAGKSRDQAAIAGHPAGRAKWVQQKIADAGANSQVGFKPVQNGARMAACLATLK